MRHNPVDDGKQSKGKFSTMDTPMNITTEGGGAAPAGDNLVPTGISPDPLGLNIKGGGKDLGPGKQ